MSQEVAGVNEQQVESMTEEKKFLGRRQSSALPMGPRHPPGGLQYVMFPAITDPLPRLLTLIFLVPLNCFVTSHPCNIILTLYSQPDTFFSGVGVVYS